MNRLDKKQIFLGTILGIILSILTLILLTRNIQPLSAQQTQQKYTVFKSQNLGFKFVNLSGQYLPIFAQNIIIPYNVKFWLNIPEMRGNPFNPALDFPGDAELEINLCTKGSSSFDKERLSYKVKIIHRNNDGFKIVPNPSRPSELVDEYEFNSAVSAGLFITHIGNNRSYYFVRNFGCPKKIWAVRPSFLSFTDAGVENEKRYLNIAIMHVYAVDDIFGVDIPTVRLSLKWSSRSGPYKVPINVTIYASY
jgi:hypothetical protein